MNLKQIFDKVAEKVADILGSAPVVIGFTGWLIYHNIGRGDYVAFISDVAILIGLLILRAETVQSRRMEEYIKRDLKQTKEVKETLEASQNGKVQNRQNTGSNRHRSKGSR